VHLVVKHRYNAWGAEEGSAETSVWKERNARIFNRQETSVTMLLEKIKAEANLWIVGGAKALRDVIVRSYFSFTNSSCTPSLFSYINEIGTIRACSFLKKKRIRIQGFVV